jgi:hypothetical protein
MIFREHSKLTKLNHPKLKFSIFFFFFFLFCIKNLIDQVISTTLCGEREKKELNQWGVTVDKDMIQVPARRCPPPNLLFGNEERVRPNNRNGLNFFFFFFLNFKLCICNLFDYF